jgi:hypothetical protein
VESVGSVLLSSYEQQIFEIVRQVDNAKLDVRTACEVLEVCELIFLYQQDIQKLIDNSDAFDAFLCGLTAYLLDLGKCEPRPKNFPKTESWIAIPRDL